MRRGRRRREAPARGAVHRAMRAGIVVACSGLITSGCSTAGPGLASAGFGATTVAFESIDGPPETVFKKLVLRLTEEAATRRVAVVSRDDAAQYRVRGYISAHVQGRKTTLAWIWDVFDADRHRMMRIAGEVPGAASERAWAAADDEVIGRIAHDGGWQDFWPCPAPWSRNPRRRPRRPPARRRTSPPRHRKTARSPPCGDRRRNEICGRIRREKQPARAETRGNYATGRARRWRPAVCCWRSGRRRRQPNCW
jgi:hypothetical protein